jgi:hypothetical protein
MVTLFSVAGFGSCSDCGSRNQERTLVTNDRNLKAVVQDLGGDAIGITQFTNIDDA